MAGLTKNFIHFYFSHALGVPNLPSIRPIGRSKLEACMQIMRSCMEHARDGSHSDDGRLQNLSRRVCDASDYSIADMNGEGLTHDGVQSPT